MRPSTCALGWLQRRPRTVFGTQDMVRACQEADVALVCYEEKTNLLLGVLVGRYELDGRILRLTGVAVLSGASLCAVLRRFLARLSRHRRIQGLIAFVSRQERETLTALGFREADLRPERYRPQVLCYGPVCRWVGDDDVRRMSLLLSISDRG